MNGFRTIGSRTVARAAFLRIDGAVVMTPEGDAVERVVVAHPGAVAVVPVLDGDVILIEQHRPAIERALLEIPAGKLDLPGEPRPDTAIRELEEEIGYTPGTLVHLTDLLTTPGFSDECISIYLGIDLTAVPARPVGVEEDHAGIVRMPLERAVAMVHDGTIRDAKTIAGLLLAAGR